MTSSRSKTARSAACALVVCVALLISPKPAAAQSSPSCPPDLPRSSFEDIYPLGAHAFDIDCLAWRSVVNPEPSFRPTQPLARWEMATWLDSTLKWVQPRYEDVPHEFIDLTPIDLPTRQSIEAMRQFDVTNGVGGGRFDPFGTVPRWQMALFLTRAFAAAGFELPTSPSAGFDDIKPHTAETQTAIAQLAELGITRGTSTTTFSPYAPVSREQMASFVVRLLDRIWVVDLTPSSCGSGQPQICTIAETSAVAPTPLTIRAPLFMADHIGDLNTSEALIRHSATRIEIDVDGVAQSVVPTVRRGSGTVYGYWATDITPASAGVVGVRVRVFIAGIPTSEWRGSIDFK